MKALLVKDGVPTDFSSLTIKGDRISLVPITDDFADEIFREFDSSITQYMIPKPADDISEINDFITTSQLGMQQGQELAFAITQRSTQEFLGICCCKANQTPVTPELGIWLKRSAHGHKFGLESIATLVQWVMTHLDYEYLIYPVDRANLASRNIPESLGGKVFAERKVESMAGTMLDEVTYQIKSAPIALAQLMRR